GVNNASGPCGFVPRRAIRRPMAAIDASDRGPYPFGQSCGAQLPVMLKDPKIRRILLISGAAVVVAGIAGFVLFQDALFRMSIAPSGRFSAEAAPQQLDYTRKESWALRPAQPPPGGWEKPWGIDTFFIGPVSD